MQALLLYIALVANAPLVRNLEIQAPLADTTMTILLNQDEFAEYLNVIILEHEIESMRPRWIIGKNSRVSWLVKGRLKIKVKIPGLDDSAVLEFRETIEIGKRVIYLLELKEGNIIKRLDTRIELWEEDGKGQGTAELRLDLNVSSRWNTLYGRILLTKINKAFKELTVESDNQNEGRDQQDTPQFSIGGFLPGLY